ncbi:MAG: hypothetical protein NT009_10015 [Proteobacteria bacterium]|nr:hypothetical protein [Pseudomonadota bacterium]
MESSGINWKQIVVTAIITGIIAILVGMILYYLQKREPKLTYLLSDTIPFSGDKETLAIYHIIIRNEGRNIVDDVDFHIDSTPALIKNHRITGASAMNYTENIYENSYKVHFADLNPGESVTVSILTSSKLNASDHPRVTLRGKGILGEAANNEETKKNKILGSPIFSAIISAYSVLFALYFLIKTRRLPSSKIGRFFDTDTHSDHQNEIIAYLFNMHGLTEIAEEYLKRQRIPSYWSEADYIAAVAVESDDPNIKEKRKRILIDLLSYAVISPSSKGIIHYDIARIAKSQKRNEECDEHINAAKDIIPKLLKKRLSLDPIFK